ncbi:MAG TPA: hypothetical protein VF503_29395 [Sphingobium sp.]|uniref:hypothetical protein n=1 Tax=Sphingobium sp. TaxID=1912891 RepID=UPI002ED56B33
MVRELGRSPQPIGAIARSSLNHVCFPRGYGGRLIGRLRRRCAYRQGSLRECSGRGCDSDFDVDEAFCAHRLNCLYTLLNSVTSLTMIADTAHNREMLLRLLELRTAAVLDYQSLDLLRDRVAIAIT